MTNLSERDVADYDLGFWRSQWRRTRLQGLIANGIASFATFPSRNPHVPTSRFAPERDLLGEIVAAAREDDIRLCVRMDSNIIPPPVLREHADWRIRRPDGTRLDEMCINSPYRREVVFGLYAEIIDRYGVDGFTDNGGIGAGRLCHCEFCCTRWAGEVGGPMPWTERMDDPLFRRWTDWNNGRVMENWDDSDAYVRSVGGEECLFLPLVRKFSPFNRLVARRARQVMMDCQSRNDAGSFREHTDEGLYMKGTLDWTRNIAVVSSMTHHSHGYFRLTSDSAAEARTYMLSGIAGGFDPWWHHPTGYSPDRRSFDIAPPVFAWQAEHEDLLHDRQPIAAVGLIRSERNDQFFGRDIGPFFQPEQMGEVTQATYRGASRMLSDARVPYRPLHIADITDPASTPPVLLLPNLGGMSDEEVAAIRCHVEAGGGLVATGMTSLFDADGEPRTDFALADVLGVSISGVVPDRRALIDGRSPHDIAIEDLAPQVGGAVLNRVLPYGGVALDVEVREERRVVARLAGRPAAILGRYGAGRVVFLPIDIDRRYLREPQPVARDLIAAFLRWCAPDGFPVEVEGPGNVGVTMWSQGDARILHLVNMSGIDSGDTLIEPLAPVGAQRVRFTQLADGAVQVRSLVTNRAYELVAVGGALEMVVDGLRDHEVLVLEQTDTSKEVT
jgi:hypothetical protein